MSKFEDIGVENFRKALHLNGGNLSKTAAVLGVSRSRLYSYANEHPDWKEAIADERGNFLDECLASARVLALGIGDYEEEFDPKLGKKVRKMVGWRNMPDGNMLRFLIARLGAKEGFGDYQRMTEVLNDTTNKIESIEINVTYNKKEDLELQNRMKKSDEGKV